MSAEAMTVTKAQEDSACAAPPDFGLDRDLLAMLTHPALIFVGDRILPAIFGVWLEHVMSIVAGQLTGILDVPTRVRLARAGDGARDHSFQNHESGLHLTLRHEAFSGPVRISLSDRLVEILASALSIQVAGLPGCGNVSQLELGLAEFVIRVCLHRTAMQFEGLAEFSLDELDDPPERRSDETSNGTIDLLVIAGGRRGLLRLEIPEWNAECRGRLEDSPFRSIRDLPVTALSDVVHVKLALPPLALSADELGSTDPGDVILLGSSDLDSLSSHCTLVTTKGWQIARCESVRDTPTVATTCVGPFEPQALPAALRGRATESVSILATIGNVRMPLERLAQWESGRVFEFSKRTDAPIELHAGPIHVGCGELVRVEDELGIRLIQFRSE